MDVSFDGEVFFWRGPSPWHFVEVPEDVCEALEAASALVSYGWGMVPVAGRIGATRFTTSLFPKDGRYVVPLKVAVRRAEQLGLGNVVTVELHVDT